MLGVGLSLRVADFRRLGRHPRAVAIALALQMLVLPGACLGLVELFELPPALAIGMMLLAASPGGISANLYSHLFGGHVALNISLTAINTLLSIVTLPLIANWALAHWSGGGHVPLQTAKVVEVIAVVLVPVIAGMAFARRRPAAAARLERPFKALSAVVLAAFALIAIAREWAALSAAAASIGGAVLAFNLLSLAAGYGISRLLRLDRPMSIAIGFEIGIHNSTLAIYLALSVLQDFRMALPAAAYSISMYAVGALFGWAVTRPSLSRPAPRPSAS